MTAKQSKDNLGFHPHNSEGRIFPALEADIYQYSYNLSDLAGDRKVAAMLLDLFNQNNKLSELISFTFDAKSKLSRLLNWHRLGIEKEIDGEWKQADFYWRQVQLEIHRLAKQDNLWLSLANEYAKEDGVVVMNDPVKMRQRLVEELLIDTHYAFYHGINSQADELKTKELSFRHIEYITKLVKLSSFSQEHLLGLLSHPLQKQIELYVKSEEYSKACLICENRLSVFPDSIKFQNQFIELRSKAFSAKLKNELSKKKLAKNTQKLDREISWYKKFLKVYPYNLPAFHYLGSLYNASALQLNHSKQISKSFLHVEKSLSYNPDLILSQKLKQQIQAQVEQLQTNAAAIKQEIARKNQLLNRLISGKRTTLSAHGRWIVNEASIGLSLGNNYRKSSEFKNIADAYRLAKEKYPDLVKADIANQTVIITNSSINCKLEPKFNSTKLKNEPFLPWLFSRQDLGFKMLPGFASIFLLFTGGFLGRELWATERRNRTYQEIVEASEKYDSLKAIENAEQFLAYKSVKGKDDRESEVKQLYAQAFVRWLSNKEQLNDSDWKIINRYQQLNDNKIN